MKQTSPSSRHGLTALSRVRIITLLLALSGLQFSGALQACGYEDPASVALGALNITYPNALYVGTAVWQARQDGLLPVKSPQFNGGPDTALQAGQDGRLQAVKALYQLRRHLGNDPAMPPVAVVFIPAVMWSRLVPQPDKLSLTMHVAGPQTDDVVLITEPAALQAWAGKSLTTEQLLDNGLVRLYGSVERVAQVREALTRTEGVSNAPISYSAAVD
jgi:hypothetical protein